MSTSANRLIDLNTLLRVANLISTVLVACVFTQAEHHPYLDQTTIALAVVLGVQTHVALTIERRRRDPFVLLLAFEMVFYYSFRIFTLTLYPFSNVFDRYSYSAADSNYALVFILLANVFLYAGFFLAHSSRCAEGIDSRGWRATSPLAAVALLVAAILFGYFSNSYWNEGNVPRVFGFLVLILAPSVVVLMALTYYFLYRRSLRRGVAFAIAALIALEIIVHTLVGSRSAIVGFILTAMMVVLAINGRIAFTRRFVAGGVLLMPVLVVLLVAAFAISTYNRAAKELGTSLEVGRAVQLAQQFSERAPESSRLDVLVPPIAARAGFFDFSAEIIAHRDQYRGLFTLGTYGRSIVDNILTPGFDLYDQPKIANALQFVYRGWGTPSKAQSVESYQSDQIGLYGEFYALFGYLSLPLLLVLAWTLKRAYARTHSTNPLVFALQRLVLLFIFLHTLDSFGFDWTAAEVVPLVIAMVLYKFFFGSRRLPQGRPPLPSVATPSAI